MRGAPTSTGPRAPLEWWFLKSDTPAGSVTIGITSAPFFMGELGLVPTANLLIDLPDGTSVVKHAVQSAEDFRSLPDDAGIEAGGSFYRREEDGSYRAHVEDSGITADIRLTPSAPAWRPETGHYLFGEQEEHHFGWYIPVPIGEARVSVRGEGLDIDATGTGYIDRGWMDTPLGDFLDAWNWYYWQFGPYTVAAISITFGEGLGLPSFPVFMVHRDGRLLAGGPGTQDTDHITYVVDESHIDPGSGRVIVDAFHYEYREGRRRFTLRVRNETRVELLDFADALPLPEEQKKRTSVVDGLEMRFTGPALFAHYEDDELVEEISLDEGPFCELMFMGRPRRS
jgi:hypothetical protein